MIKSHPRGGSFLPYSEQILLNVGIFWSTIKEKEGLEMDILFDQAPETRSTSSDGIPPKGGK